MKSNAIRLIVVWATLVAVAVVLMYLSFPLPLFPPWLKMEFADVAAIMGGAYTVALWAKRGKGRARAALWGVAAAVIIVGLKNVLNILFKGPTFGGVGELGNFIMGVGLCVPVVVCYAIRQSGKVLLLGAGLAVVFATALAVISNVYLLIPAAGIGQQTLNGVMQPLFVFFNWPADASALWGYGLVAVAPFNIAKMAAQCGIALFLHRRLERFLLRNV